MEIEDEDRFAEDDDEDERERTKNSVVMKKIQRHLKRILVTALVLFLVLTIVGNILAYRQAYGMMHFSEKGKRVGNLETLSVGQKTRLLFKPVKLPRPWSSKTPADLELQFEDHEIACSNGITLAAWHLPNDKAEVLVLMFHGYRADKGQLLPEADLLHQSGHAVFTVDFRGSGGSSESMTTIGYQEAEDVAHAVAYARQRWPGMKMVLFGPSMGAAAVLRAIAVHDVSPDAIIIESVFDTMLQTTKNRFTAMRVPPTPCAQVLLFWGGQQIGFNPFHHNPVEYAASVTCPALVMHGAKDPRARLEEGRRVADAIPGKKTFRVFPDLSHQSYAQAHPYEWQETIAAFLEETLGGK